jgi:hypothetical protein
MNTLYLNSELFKVAGGRGERERERERERESTIPVNSSMMASYLHIFGTGMLTPSPSCIISILRGAHYMMQLGRVDRAYALQQKQLLSVDGKEEIPAMVMRR